jgi:hypothetical protein
MITNNGRNIIAKYLLNQAPEFASHIAIGIGGNAISTSSSVSFLPDDKSLKFEVARVPVLSKGLVKESGVEKIIFKAELPSDQRFNITEIGLFPANSNLLAENYDSRIISTFDQSENWTYTSLGSTNEVQYQDDIDLSFVSSGDIEDGFLQAEKYGFINNDSENNLLIIGARKGNALAKFFLGSKTSALEESCLIPILIAQKSHS